MKRQRPSTSQRLESSNGHSSKKSKKGTWPNPSPPSTHRNWKQWKQQQSHDYNTHQFLDSSATVHAGLFGARRLPEIKSLWRHVVHSEGHFESNNFHNALTTSSASSSRKVGESGGGKISSRHLRRRTGSHRRRRRHRFFHEGGGVREFDSLRTSIAAARRHKTTTRGGVAAAVRPLPQRLPLRERELAPRAAAATARGPQQLDQGARGEARALKRVGALA